MLDYNRNRIVILRDVLEEIKCGSATKDAVRRKVGLASSYAKRYIYQLQVNGLITGSGSALNLLCITEKGITALKEFSEFIEKWEVLFNI